MTKSVKGYVREDYKVDRPHPEGKWALGCLGKKTWKPAAEVLGSAGPVQSKGLRIPSDCVNITV